MTCSLIIVNYNTRDLLQALLNSLAEFLRGYDYEVIVVDNASTDGSAQLAAEFFKQIPLQWVSNATNAGFAAANNRGLGLAQGEFVLLLNSDTLLLDDSLVRFVAQIAAMPEVGIAGCRLLNADRTLQRSCGIRPNWKTEIYNKLLLDRLWRRVPAWGSYHLSPQAHEQFQEVDWVTGACLLVRRKVLEKIGLLDEKIYMFYEDVDLCLRAKQAGYRVVYSPSATVVHLFGGSWKKNRGKTILNDAWSALYFHHKHSGAGMVVLLRVLIFCQNLLRAGFLAAACLVSASARAEGGQRLRGYVKAMRLAFIPLDSARQELQVMNAGAVA